MNAVCWSDNTPPSDAQCQRHDFDPGDTCLGGRDPHVALSDTTEPTPLAVTFVLAMVPPLEQATVIPCAGGVCPS